jgi:hypothetical protein
MLTLLLAQRSISGKPVAGKAAWGYLEGLSI